MGCDVELWNGEFDGQDAPCFMRSSFSFMRSLSSSSFFRAFSAYSSLSHFFLKSVSPDFAMYAPALSVMVVVEVW